MRNPIAILRQDTDTPEGRLVGQAAMLQDIPIQRVGFIELVNHAHDLTAGAMPVGSVEFVREAIRILGAKEPSPLSYPVELNAFLGRRIDLMPLDRVRGTRFVKPVQTKLFTGFVWHESHASSGPIHSEHDIEQLNVLLNLSPQTMLWVADPVSFQSEWRYYVSDGRVLGAARYDADGLDDAPPPAGDVLAAAVFAMKSLDDAPVSYALDLGVLASGQTVLVEVNDGWAVGHYGRALTPQAYLGFLAVRWKQIAETRPKSIISETRVQAHPGK